MKRLQVNAWSQISKRYLVTCEKNSDSRYNHLKDKILANTLISKDHLTPEIKLRLITKECKLFSEPVTENVEKIFDSDPFWAFYWPDNASVVRGRKILDVGSGSGACSIAAIMSGAKLAVANDIDYGAKVAADLNADLNNIVIETCVENLIGSNCEKFDVVLAGDVFYDKEIAGLIFPWLKQLKRNGKDIFIGDPGRHGLTTGVTQWMQKVAKYELPENSCIENNGFKFANVWGVK